MSTAVVEEEVDELEQLFLEPLDPYDFQAADIREILAHNCTGFVTAETGAGKTFIGTEVALRSNAEVILIIAVPSTFDDVWIQTIKRQDPTATVRVIEGTPLGQKAFEDLQLSVPGIYLASHQIFVRWKGEYDFTTTRPDLAIIDEAHFLGNRNSRGGKKLLKLKALRRLCMSGTMVRNKFENFWNLLRWVYPEQWRPGELADMSYHRWEAKYCATRYSPFKVGNIEVIGELIEGTLAREIPCYIQHFKRAECCDFHPEGFLSNLPAPAYIRYDVDLLPEQKKLILQMEKEFVAWLHHENEGRDGKKKPFVAKLDMTKRMRLRQMALAVPTIRTVNIMKYNKDLDMKVPTDVDRLFFDVDALSAKLDLFEEKLTEHDESYVAVTSSKPFAEEVTRRLKARGVKAELWDGDVSQIERARIKKQLRTGETRVVVAVVASISTGIDGLQDSCHRVMILDRDQDLTTMTQFFGRLDRRGQQEQVIIEEIVARGSYDKGIINKQLKTELMLARALNKRARKEALEAA